MLVLAATVDAKLAIVFTEFFYHAVCVRHPWWQTEANLAIVFFSLRLLFLTQFGETPEAEIMFPPYIGTMVNDDNIQ